MSAPTLGVPPRVSTAVSGFDEQVDALFELHLRGRPVVDRIFYAASAVADHGVVWLGFASWRALRSKDGLRAGLRAAAGVGIESAIINGPVKLLFRRARPAHDDVRPLPLRLPRTSSFPSGHATSAFCAAALLSEGDSLWPLYYAVALVVAWSRVHVRIHHASDVLAGIAIGSLLGWIGRVLVPLPESTGT